METEGAGDHNGIESAALDDDGSVEAAGISRPYVIVVGNEKGGTGKSTTAIHLSVALMRRGFRVAGVDLDPRQKTFFRFMENRRRFVEAHGWGVPLSEVRILAPSDADSRASAKVEDRMRLGRLIDELCGYDFLVVDTPGSDSPLSRLGHEAADTLVTPLNESYLDIDIIARIDRENREVLAPSVYCQMVWEQHNRRVSNGRAAIDWVVLRNRVSHIDSYSRRDIAHLLHLLSKRVGFRLSSGFGERVVFRELFPMGLTLLDLPEVMPESRDSPSHEAGRRELWGLLSAIGLPERDAVSA